MTPFEMTEAEFDFIVIGGGSAGYAAARTARNHVSRVAVLDDSEHLGGLCIRRGCMPSKTVIYSAEVLHHARHAEKFGLDIPEASADMPAIRRRKRAMVEDFAEGRVESLQSGNFSLFRQRGHFVDSHTLELDDGTHIRGKKFMIATGSVVQWPGIPGLGEVGAVTSDEILELDTLPESVAVLGGGVVACELAQYLNRLGARVTLIQRSDQVLKEFDTAAARTVEQAFRDEGMRVYTGTRLQRLEKHEDGKTCVVFDHGKELVTVSAELVFNALGRRPNTDGLNLEAAGVELASSGHIACNAFMQTSAPHIYAAGDVAGPEEIVHIAVKQGTRGALHAMGLAVEPMNYDFPLYVIFTDPQVALAGMSPGHLRERGIEHYTASYPFDDHGKSILMEAKYGYVKIMAEKSSGRIMGAECVGKDAGELIHALQVAIGVHATVFDLLKIDWYHPTLSEIWEYPLEEIADRIESDRAGEAP